MRLCVGKQPLLGGNLGDVELNGLVLRLDFQNFLVERGGTREEPFVHQVIRDLRVLRGRLVRLSGAHVQIAQSVPGVPVARLLLDDAHVLRDREIELALTEQLLGFFERLFAF